MIDTYFSIIDTYFKTRVYWWNT